MVGRGAVSAWEGIAERHWLPWAAPAPAPLLLAHGSPPLLISSGPRANIASMPGGIKRHANRHLASECLRQAVELGADQGRSSSDIAIASRAGAIDPDINTRVDRCSDCW